MVGAIVGIVIFNLVFGMAFMPSEAKVAAQIVSGAFIGVGISREEIKQFKRLFKPLAILISCMMVLNLASGMAIYFVSDFDLMTSMFCAVPGGMSNTPIIAAEMGADGAKVALMQFIRLSAGIGIFPSIIKQFGRNEENISSEAVEFKKTSYSNFGFLITSVVAIAGGIIGEILDIPAGALLFSLIATMTAKQFLPACMLPGWIKRMAQVLAGAYIATGISPKDIPEMGNIIMPAMIMLLGYFAACIIIGKLISRYGAFSINEGMLAATPAGASDMALIAADIGISSPDVIVLQIGRMLSAVLIFPNVINFIIIFF